VSLGKWANQEIHSKTEAAAVLDQMREAIRKGTFSHGPSSALTFEAFANVYQQRYVVDRQLRSADTIDQRLRLLRRRFGNRHLADINLGDIEDLRADLRAAGKKPATINRYLALLRNMLNWGVLRGDLAETPFRKGSQAVIKLERENNRRDRRLASDEEGRLFGACTGVVHALVVAALETGMRKGELLSLRFGDIDFERNVIHIRAENAKSKRGRDIPIATTRLRTLLKFLSQDANGEAKLPDAPVFSNEAGEAIEDFRSDWDAALKKAGITNLRFHDLRGEFASRLVERGVPLSQVRDLLGHASVVTTERYDRQKFEALEGAVKRLDTGESFNFLSIDAALGAPDASSEDSTGAWKSMSVN
jgi:integrase